MSQDTDVRAADPVLGRLAEAILIPPGAWHTLENDGTSELTILCMCSPPYSDEDTFFE